MSGGKVDVLWSPHHEDKFVVLASDLRLYKVEAIKDKTQKSQLDVNLSDETCATLLCANSENQLLKCAAWYPKPQPDTLIAVGLANGKVVLTSFGKSGINDPQNLIDKEFVPRANRQCNYLAWNPHDPSLLAEGLDKAKYDGSIYIWNVHAAAPEVNYADKRHSAAIETIKPLCEVGPNEVTSSFAWLPQERQHFVAGMGRHLKIYDLRDYMHAQSTTSTSAVHGVCVDPKFNYRLASFYENRVNIFDTRNFDKPILTIPEISSRGISKLSWSPIRPGLLSVLPKESPCIKLYDIQNPTSVTDELESAVIERIVQPFNNNLLSYDWHKSQENRLLVFNEKGAMRDTKIYERIALTWSPNICMAWACGSHLSQCHSARLSKDASEDISVKMKRRAEKNYGLEKKDLRITARIVQDDPKLKHLWMWLHHARNQQPNNSVTHVLQGVKQILKDTQSVAIQREWIGNFTGRVPQQTTYFSEQRAKAVELSGWSLDTSNFPTLERLCEEHRYENAATIAVFNQQITKAIDILKSGSKADKGGGSSLAFVAMALYGFTNENNALWKEQCKDSQMHHPYLNAMFAFLTNTTENYDSILFDDGLLVMDRVAFACLYLTDNQLIAYIDKLSKQLITGGHLEGILLTGLTGLCVPLLENYLDRTCDIQTVCLLALQGFASHDLATNSKVSNWIQNYRDLLNNWMLWHHRSELDVFHSSLQQSIPSPTSASSPTSSYTTIAAYSPESPYSSYSSSYLTSFTTGTLMRQPMTSSSTLSLSPTPEAAGCQCQQIYVNCNFCSKNIAFSADRNRQFTHGNMTHRPKVTSCLSCRKPLPRCSLCLINMGTASGNVQHLRQYKDSHTPSSSSPNTHKDSSRSKMTEFSEWFTWCQSCRHGGHASHLDQWFSTHKECPITGCTCQCINLDCVSENVAVDTEKTQTLTHLT